MIDKRVRALNRLGIMPTGLFEYSTATLSDGIQKIGLKNQVLEPAIRPLLPFTKMVGTAVTVKLARSDDGSEGSYSRLLVEAYASATKVIAPILVLEQPPEVRGATVMGSGNAHVIRDLYGFVGCVSGGAIRDSDEIKQMEFPVYCRAVHPEFIWGVLKGISYNEPVLVGGVQIGAGDIIVGDNDGVVAIPFDRLSDVLKAADEILQEEVQVLKAIEEKGYTVEAIQEFQPQAVKESR